MFNINHLTKYWKIVGRLPFGKRLFDFIVSIVNPYTGSMHARVQELEPGYAKQNKNSDRVPGCFSLPNTFL